MTPDDRTRLIPPAADQVRPPGGGGGETVDRPDDGTQPSVRVAVDSTDPSATRFRIPDSDDAEPLAPSLEHYQLLGELGRGGMGVVYRALDTRLKRDVAIKVLSERMVGKPTAERRFVEEALVTGQLTHTAIPPVHELGRLPDGRQFLVMKLIKGHTLGELLKARANPSADLATHLGTLEQVCQGVGYAHSRGVIHRDLKPANIMVGAFREVLVMDWGLAREVRNAEQSERVGDTDFAVGDATAPAADQPAPPDTVLRDVREAGEEFTRAGTILGTPAYMAPEQAMGDQEAVGPRSDVFSLGAILCVVLTGQPPYTGKTANEVVLKAIHWETADAFRRLGHCKADPLVVDLCKRCLAKEPAHRPANGEVVAAELAEIRATAAERLRRTDLAEMARLTKLREAKRRRRWQIGLAAAVACNLALLAAAGWYAWYQNQKAEDALRKVQADSVTELKRQLDEANDRAAEAKWQSEVLKKEAEEALQAEAKRAEREAAISAAAQLMETALEDARTAGDETALDAAIGRGRAGLALVERFVLNQPSSDLTPRVKRLCEQVKVRDKQGRLVATLDDIAAPLPAREQVSERDPESARLYKLAFQEAGFSELDPAKFTRQVGDHLMPAALIEAVFDWHFHAATADRPTLATLLDEMVVYNPSLAKWWAAQKDATPAGTKALITLAGAGNNPWVAHRMACDLWHRGERDASVGLLRKALIRLPADFRLHFRLALFLVALDTPAARDEAFTHATAATALRPNSVTASILLSRLAAERSGKPADALEYLNDVISRGNPVLSTRPQKGDDPARPDWEVARAREAVLRAKAERVAVNMKLNSVQWAEAELKEIDKLRKQFQPKPPDK